MSQRTFRAPNGREIPVGGLIAHLTRDQAIDYLKAIGQHNPHTPVFVLQAGGDIWSVSITRKPGTMGTYSGAMRGIDAINSTAVDAAEKANRLVCDYCGRDIQDDCKATECSWCSGVFCGESCSLDRDGYCTECGVQIERRPYGGCPSGFRQAPDLFDVMMGEATDDGEWVGEIPVYDDEDDGVYQHDGGAFDQDDDFIHDNLSIM